MPNMQEVEEAVSSSLLGKISGGESWRYWLYVDEFNSGGICAGL